MMVGAAENRMSCNLVLIGLSSSDLSVSLRKQATSRAVEVGDVSGLLLPM